MVFFVNQLYFKRSVNKLVGIAEIFTVRIMTLFGEVSPSKYKFSKVGSILRLFLMLPCDNETDASQTR